MPSPMAHERVEHYGSGHPAETPCHLASVDMGNEPLSSSTFSKEAEKPYFSWVILSLHSTKGAY